MEDEVYVVFKEWLRRQHAEIPAARYEAEALRSSLDPRGRRTHSSETKESGMGNAAPTTRVQSWKDIARSFLKLGATSCRDRGRRLDDASARTEDRKLARDTHD